ncbi:M48 family metallopeptidase [Streptomyces sp. CBMA152]|uniref:tetratricopeptide repeat protein n=1 Tax=Streptomyces sp. CBMA152 TaxID=1896312 RepID=UPI001660B3E0|nr:hypothetical protein [Streptomyces sp. CBMA152]MBD0741406.1 hypothetical protein [Streptomyces sp. CBMA152]
MQGENQEAVSAYAAAQTQLRAGRLAQARRTAEEALEADGPAAPLFLVLGQAHVAEDDDDHDDRAEAAYREGLKAFPDDLDLLAAYAELCLRSDYIERPARHRRGPELAAQLRELAPGSRQALRIEQVAAGKGRSSVRLPSPGRTQAHDVRLVLAAVGDPAAAAAQARAHAQTRPDDDRLATLAETLDALARPGRAPIRWMVRFPLRTLLIHAVWCIGLLLAVPAFHWDGWLRALAFVAAVPTGLRDILLRRARRRTDPQPLAVATESIDVPGFPVLPPVPAYSRREVTAAGLVLAAVLTASAGSGIWSYRQYVAYPRYTVAAPDRLRGYERLEDTPIQRLLENNLRETMAGSGATTFTFVYGNSGPKRQPVLGAALFGAVGDFHEMTSKDLESIQGSLDATGLTTVNTWKADPGRLGGTMRCAAYRALVGGQFIACTWGDKGSIGTVLSPDAGQGQGAAAELARQVREAVLHQGSPANDV